MCPRDPVADKALSRRCIDDAISDEIRERFFIEMLELAAATGTEMAAWRHGAVWTGHDCAVSRNAVTRRGEREVAAAFRHAIATRSDPDDRFCGQRQSASAEGMAWTSCEDVNAGPHSRAA